MKLLDHFNDLLTDVVNLNSSRIVLLEGSIAALEAVIRASDWKPKVHRFEPQGSWAHKTIIKPVAGRPFDADLLVYVAEVKDWDAKTYLAELRRIFADHATYCDKVSRSSHCVTIDYSGERKIDLAPVVVDRGRSARSEVCNFDTNGFELTEPDRYTQWLVQRNEWTGSNQLRKVTRLLKFLRDIKTNFTCPSVLLTTLLGERVTAPDLVGSEFPDLPTSLKTIVGRLDDWLQLRVSRPEVRNPVLASEVFSNRWDDTKYANFRERFHTYREWIDEAYDEPDRDESIGKWRRVFGEDFAAGAVEKRAASVSLARDVVGESLVRSFGTVTDLVARFAKMGRSALPDAFDRLPHKQRPRWRRGPQAFTVRVEATLHEKKGGPVTQVLSPGSTMPLRKWQSIRFSGRTDRGTLLLELLKEFEIHWRVTNTDEQAKAAGCLRGGFEPSDDGASRWESLSYRGVHMVEAFVVRRRDAALVATSDPFYVVVE